jgi:hypothetical protein
MSGNLLVKGGGESAGPQWVILSLVIYIGNFSDTAVYEKVCKVLKKTSLVKGIKKASPIAQTSCLEGFHSVLNQFATKIIAYSYQGM